MQKNTSLVEFIYRIQRGRYDFDGGLQLVSWEFTYVTDKGIRLLHCKERGKPVLYHVGRGIKKPEAIL